VETARLAGKVALITGAGAGIGRAAARLFAREGASVVIAEVDAKAGADAAREIEAEGGQASFVRTDVTQPDSVAASVDAAIRKFGRLDILYNNAGGSSPADRPVTEGDPEEFWRVIRLNLFGVWLCCRYGIPALIKSGGGSVINMASAMGLEPTAGRDSYTAAKGGVVSLTRSMAVEYAANNVRVNALAPGFTASERVAGQLAAMPDYFARLQRQHPLGFGEPMNVAYFALFLASDESRFTSGQIFQVNNQMTGI